MMHGASIYFIGNKECGFVKIGVTDGHVIKRINALQTGNPYNLFCYGVIRFESARSAYREEKRIHRAFSFNRIRGEWFYFTHDIKGFIDDVFEDSETIQYDKDASCAVTEYVVKNKINTCDSRYAAAISDIESYNNHVRD